MPNVNYDLIQFLDLFSSQMSFDSIASSPVFEYIKAPSQDMVHTIPAMYLPLLLIVPIWMSSRTIQYGEGFAHTSDCHSSVSDFQMILLFNFNIEINNELLLHL